jgi:hypothetical protein
MILGSGLNVVLDLNLYILWGLGCRSCPGVNSPCNEYIIATISNTDGVAVYATAWRITGIAVAPLIGILISMSQLVGLLSGKLTLKKLRTPLFIR